MAVTRQQNRGRPYGHRTVERGKCMKAREWGRGGGAPLNSTRWRCRQKVKLPRWPGSRVIAMRPPATELGSN